MTARQERQARDKVIRAAADYGSCYGEAQFKRGYRCGKGQGWWNTPEAASIEARENQLHAIAGKHWEALRRALAVYSRAVRKRAKEAK